MNTVPGNPGSGLERAFRAIPPRWMKSVPNYPQWTSVMGARWQHAVRCMHCGGLKKQPGLVG